MSFIQISRDSPYRLPERKFAIIQWVLQYVSNLFNSPLRPRLQRQIKTTQFHEKVFFIITFKDKWIITNIDINWPLGQEEVVFLIVRVLCAVCLDQRKFFYFFLSRQYLHICMWIYSFIKDMILRWICLYVFFFIYSAHTIFKSFRITFFKNKCNIKKKSSSNNLVGLLC